MDWLFELSAACALVALALPFVFKLMPTRAVLRPARVRVAASPHINPEAARGADIA